MQYIVYIFNGNLFNFQGKIRGNIEQLNIIFRKNFTKLDINCLGMPKTPFYVRNMLQNVIYFLPIEQNSYLKGQKITIQKEN